MRFELQGPGNHSIVQWDGGAFDGEMPVVTEEGTFGLIVSDDDSDSEYAINVGEERIEVGCQRFSGLCLLEKGPYFESAYAKTKIAVIRKEDGGVETKVAECDLYVLPSKIGRENYQRMVADLQSICRSLVNDLIGKSRHGQDWGFDLRPFLFRSMEEELAAIRKTWTELAPLIEEVSTAPVSNTMMWRTMTACGRNRTYRGIPAMMKLGIDPRNPSPGRRCPTFRMKETVDVPEHRLIKGFMTFLSRRLEKCRGGVKEDIDNIESERQYRSRSVSPDEPSLYEKEDVPRLQKLRRHLKTTEELSGRIQETMVSGFWNGVETDEEYPDPRQFSGNACYLEVANIILRYLRNGLNTGWAYGEDFMTKKSSRMYEQWVLVQLVTAMERCGLAIETWNSVIRRSISHQFGLDFKKNTRFLAKLANRYSVLLRYEPWILPHGLLATHQDETLCHFGSIDSFWNPDFMIELQRIDDGVARTIYAVALDAKYSRNPSNAMRNNVSKYKKIRSNDGQRGRQVTKQVWLVYPGSESIEAGIFVDDDSMEFLPSFGPVYADSGTCDRVEPDELITGDIVIRPSAIEALDRETETNMSSEDVARGIVLYKPLFDFVKGTLSYFQNIISTSE